MSFLLLTTGDKLLLTDNTSRLLLAGGAASFSLTADTGAFVLSGQAATLRRGRKLSVTTGSYVTSGQAASLRRGLLLTATNGAFSMTGVAALLRRGYKLTAGAAVYNFNSPGARLLYNRVLRSERGEIVLLGNDAFLFIPLPPVPERTAFVLAQDRRVNSIGKNRTVAVLLKDRIVTPEH